jgi:pimeloyl-ACP methyl ester carboxylesterase
VVKWVWRIVGALVLVTAPGIIYEQVSESKDLERFPAPGKLYDVGDHRLHLYCEGEGTPTVILEASGLGTTSGYDAVIPLVAKRTRVCAYDRAGMGYSEPNPRALTAAELSADLERLLKAAKLEPPYLIVGASIGGLTAEMFTRTHPEQVRGLVWLDAVDSQGLEVVGTEISSMRFKVCAAAWAGRVGLLRLIDPLHLDGRAAAVTYRASPFDAVCSLLGHLTESDQELAGVAPLKEDLPLRAMSHEQPVGLLPPGEDARAMAFEPAWQNLQRSQGSRSSRAEQWTVAKSGHLIARDQPGAVAQAILELIAP